jgi:hypothetical protein
MSPVKYEQGFYIAEDDILHSHRRENLKSYTGCHLTYSERAVSKHKVIQFHVMQYELPWLLPV